MLRVSNKICIFVKILYHSATMSNDNKEKILKELQELGAHIAMSASRRHPSMSDFLLGKKVEKDIFDLEKTLEQMDKAKDLLKSYIDKDYSVLFVGTKNEARKAEKEVAEKHNQAYVNLRYIGGTITNFPEIKKRLSRFKDLNRKFESGSLDVYTKKERLMLEREMNKLNEKFGGIIEMNSLPQILVVVDADREKIAVKEAMDKSVPVIAISNSDNEFRSEKTYITIPANDNSAKTIKYILEYISG